MTKVLVVDESEAADARRFRWMLTHPEGGRHLLQLLGNGKGDTTDFRNMIDRLERSEVEATRRG